MKTPTLIPILILLLLRPVSVVAQHSSSGTLPSAPREASQFDFLVGTWDLTVRPKVNSLAARIHGQPTLTGSWRATRSFDGWGITDELRIVDNGGNTRSLSTALRVFDPSAQRWSITVLDVFRARFSPSTATWANNQMTSTASGTDQEGRPVLMRTRFYDITPQGFKWQQDRSNDSGRTWDEAVLRIEARRR